MFYKFTKSFISFILDKQSIQHPSPFNQIYRENYKKLWIDDIKNYNP